MSVYMLESWSDKASIRYTNAIEILNAFISEMFGRSNSLFVVIGVDWQTSLVPGIGQMCSHPLSASTVRKPKSERHMLTMELLHALKLEAVNAWEPDAAFDIEVWAHLQQFAQNSHADRFQFYV